MLHVEGRVHGPLMCRMGREESLGCEPALWLQVPADLTPLSIGWRASSPNRCRYTAMLVSVPTVVLDSEIIDNLPLTVDDGR
jgi:hypothetical protein